MAIRLIFVTMKKILILIFACVLCGISYAQDMTITFSGNNATITIGDKSFNQDSLINICKEIRKVKILEQPKPVSYTHLTLPTNSRV